ncbi:MAG: AAA family ATPase [Clostridiales bacterium]|jgi:predicted ATPase|nr:AAA family ATPase [Clostridiales bacterium]
MINKIKITNFLCFSAISAEVDIRDLNVIIGRNGSGKSSFIKAIDLLRSAPSASSFASDIKGGRASDWLYKGYPGCEPATIEYTLANVDQDSADLFPEVKYTLSFSSENGEFVILSEKLAGLSSHEDAVFYDSNNGFPLARVDGELIQLKSEAFDPTQSFFSQLRDPTKYVLITKLARAIESIKIYGTWHLGPNPVLSQAQTINASENVLQADYHNMPQLLKSFESLDAKKAIIEDLQFFRKELEDYTVVADNGADQVWIKEKGLCHPVTLLSNGMFRYLSFLSIFRNPTLPPLICIEDPELGLHPSLLPFIGNIMKSVSSQNCKIIVATHSTELVNAYAETPEYVLVAEKDLEGAWISRLVKEELSLGENTLGELCNREQTRGLCKP